MLTQALSATICNGYLNLFAFVMNPLADNLAKVEILLDWLFEILKRYATENFMA
jgi:hypothetical protein